MPSARRSARRRAARRLPRARAAGPRSPSPSACVDGCSPPRVYAALAFTACTRCTSLLHMSEQPSQPPMRPRSSRAGRGSWSRSGALARGALRAPAASTREAADAAIDALRERGSPSHDGVAARLVGYTQDPSRASRSSCSRCAGRCGWSPATPPQSVAALCVTRSADGRWLAGRRAAWLVLLGGTLGARGRRRGRPRREPGRHARARAAGGVVGHARAGARARRWCGCPTSS